jgi:WD40 repeat protein
LERHRILWGYKSGAIGFTTLNKQGSNRFFKQFLDFHAGPVSVLAWSSKFMNVVVSGGEDGLVNLWNVNSGRCIKSLRTGKKSLSIVLEIVFYFLTSLFSDNV